MNTDSPAVAHVSGHLDLTDVEFQTHYAPQLEQAVARGCRFVVGDARGADLLFQAEGSMLAAVDSLGVSAHDTAVLQEKDAQQYLVEARNKLEQSLNKNNNAMQVSMAGLEPEKLCVCQLPSANCSASNCSVPQRYQSF